MGSNADEGGLHVDSLPIRTPAQFKEYLEGNFGAHTDEALSVYPGNNEADVLASLSAVFGDTQFTLGARGLSRALRSREEKTYRYLYAHPAKGKLPVHGGQQVYVFGTGQDWTDEDRAISEGMQRQWTAVATTGSPNGPGVAWPGSPTTSPAIRT